MRGGCVTHQEIELKILLDERSYFLLQHSLEREGRLIRVVRQINHYLDTPAHLMLNSREMLRVRAQDNELILTHKSRVQVEEGRFVSHEREVILPVAPPFNPLLHPRQFPMWFEGIHEVLELGTMQNMRQVFSYRGLTLELDCSTYGLEEASDRDWELECEHPDPELVRHELSLLFARLDIPMIPQTRTKFQRFMHRVKAQFDKDIGVR